MTDPSRPGAGHLRGFSKLTVEAILELADLVEAVHRTVVARPWPLGKAPTGPTTGTTGLVYSNIRGVTRLVGRGLDASLLRLQPLLGEAPTSRRRERLLAALNGVLGDYLEESGSPLAIRMQVRRNGRHLVPEQGRIARTIPDASGRVLLLVHGLCMGEACWSRGGHDHGAALERDLGCTVVALSYNTGRHVSANGRELARLIEELVSAWPVPLVDLSVVAHSTGGLVTRSALHEASAAGLGWPRSLRRVVFLGTPHHGAPLERMGSFVHEALGVSPYSRPFGRLGRVRSAGITDLRHGSLLEEDRAGLDRFARHGDRRTPVPLPDGIAFYAVAATKAKVAGGLRDRFVGDGLVPVASALGRHQDPARTLRFPPSRTWVAEGMSHFDLLSRPEVYERLRRWLEEGSPPRPPLVPAREADLESNRRTPDAAPATP